MSDLKENLFISKYTDKTNKKTYGNATQAAIAAGYEEGQARTQGYRLLKKEKIKKVIDLKMENDEIRRIDSIDKAVDEAWKNYEASKTSTEKRNWFLIIMKLSGWDVQRIDQKVDIKDKVDDVNEALRRSQFLRTN